MHVMKSRWTALIMAGLLTAFLPGCLIDNGSGPGGALTHVKVSPDVNLHAAPEGYVYEIWISKIEVESDSVFTFNPLAPVVRFQWDPYLYAATDEEGEFLPLTIGNGMELDSSFDVGPYFDLGEDDVAIAYMTIEPINDPQPAIPNGPVFLALNLDPLSHQTTMINPFALLPFFGGGVPIASFNLISQSNKYGCSGCTWHDSLSEGYGIWFATPRLTDGSITDNTRGWTANEQVLFAGPLADTAYTYVVWYNSEFPESSFSNFGRVLTSHEPNFAFRDGFPEHAPDKCAPLEFCAGSVVQGSPQPVVIEGETVGYRYIVDNVSGARDTCVLRIDNPALTRCTRDTFQTLRFDTSYFLPTVIRTTNGDTSMATTLTGVLDLSDQNALNQVPNGAGFLFLGWEYEAWLVFTAESGIKPMSLGRFKAPDSLDSGNPYTNNANYDPHFTYPGEDFLQNLSQHDPSLSGPLDVIYDPRVEKIWITIEPDDDAYPFPGVGPFNYDWAVAEPNTQLIYLSAYIPKVLKSPAAFSRSLIHRDINPNPIGLNEGNFFPAVTVRFNPAPSEE